MKINPHLVRSQRKLKEFMVERKCDKLKDSRTGGMFE